jgi:hypothetical protein
MTSQAMATTATPTTTPVPPILSCNTSTAATFSYPGQIETMYLDVTAPSMLTISSHGLASSLAYHFGLWVVFDR